MAREFEFGGEWYSVDDYLPCHYLENQQFCAVGIPLNPTLRDDFDNTPNEERDPLELKDWWGQPFIAVIDCEKMNINDADWRKEWLLAWPEGRYEVRCLDGLAWDRSSFKGAYRTLDAAIAAVRKLSVR